MDLDPHHDTAFELLAEMLMEGHGHTLPPRVGAISGARECFFLVKYRDTTSNKVYWWNGIGLLLLLLLLLSLYFETLDHDWLQEKV